MKTNKQIREFIYENWHLVEYDSKKMSVNDANKLYLAYFAEGNSTKTAEIQAKIVEVKTKIRTDYPD
jgi:hypothetical protein